jgi:hypothetical protein
VFDGSAILEPYTAILEPTLARRNSLLGRPEKGRPICPLGRQLPAVRVPQLTLEFGQLRPRISCFEPDTEVMPAHRCCPVPRGREDPSANAAELTRSGRSGTAWRALGRFDASDELEKSFGQLLGCLHRNIVADAIELD